jgi:fatty-acyl-CoA synthase
VTNLLHSLPTTGAQALRALSRYPTRTAFSWSGGSISYRGASERIARMQRVLMNTGASPAARVALLSANRADAWCALPSQISRLATTSLHPLASLEDQIDQIEDCEAEILVIDADAFLKRGGELAARAVGWFRGFFTEQLANKFMEAGRLLALPE